MSAHNGPTAFPPRRVAQNARNFAHDVVALAELQADLLRADIRDHFRRLIAPAVLLIIAMIVLMGCVPVAFAALAFGLVEAGMARSTAFLISAVAGTVMAGISGGWAWLVLRKLPAAFTRSSEEFNRNVRWIKRVLKSTATSGANDAWPQSHGLNDKEPKHVS